MNILTGPLEARQVSRRIAAPETSTTTIKAIPAARRNDGMLCVDLATSALWVFDSDSSANASESVLVPDAGSGRWLSASSGALADDKVSVRAATTAGLTATRTGNVLLADANGALAAQDGVTMVVGDRILVKDQGTGADNGIYYITALGAAGAKHSFTRAPDADTSAKVTAGAHVYVSEGTVAGNHAYVLTTDDAITLNTTALTFTKQPIFADLLSAANGLGASLIGIEDTATKFDATTVEGALNELTLTTAGNGAAIIGIEDSATKFDSTTVEGALNELTLTTAGNGASIIGLEDAGGLLAAVNVEAAILEMLKIRISRQVRGVVYNDQANLAAFVVASDDGITYVEGDRVLLANQTTVAQCGVYVVGVVAGTAPLTRATDMPTGMAYINGTVIEVSEGTFYAGSSWKSLATGAKIVGTDDPLFYPRSYRQQVTLSAGTYTIGFGSTATPDEPLFLFSTTKSSVHVQRVTAGGTLTNVIGYTCALAQRVAGKPGTAVAVVRSAVAAGTIDTNDTSVVEATICNW